MAAPKVNSSGFNYTLNYIAVQQAMTFCNYWVKRFAYCHQFYFVRLKHNLLI